MQKIDYKKIITQEEFKKVKEDNKRNLITIANFEVCKFKEKNLAFYTFGIEKEYAREIANSGLCAQFNSIEKEIMATSIAYESEELIKSLIKANILFEHLDGLCNKLLSLKKEYLKNKNSKIFESENYKKFIEILNKICFMIGFSSKIQDEYLLINKLMYLVAFEKELYLKLQQNKIKKPQ